MKYKEKIERGMLWLDQHVPDWANRLSVGSLDMRDDRCVLGQLFGSYRVGRAELLASVKDAAPDASGWLRAATPAALAAWYGFALEGEPGWSFQDRATAYRSLTWSWCRAILERRRCVRVRCRVCIDHSMILASV